MPVYNAAHHLDASLPPLLALDDERLYEVLVVDDGSTDASRECAARYGVRLLASGGRLGPGAARNAGARHAQGQILLFVDSDVVMRPDAFARITDAFSDPKTVAVFGSYDDQPADPGFMSQYMNLRHHHGHRIPSDAASTFWAGMGAVRRADFLAVGGFDAERYPAPSIEDIELGYRLRQAGGRIRRDPRAQATHLKRWSLRQGIYTDVVRRAIPWARLMLEHPGAFTDLNVGGNERFKAGLAVVLALALIAALFLRVSPWLPVAFIALAGLLDRELVTLFAKRRGGWFALRGLLFHQLYYLYSAASFLGCGLWHRAGRGA